jgi:hypothetical protein
MLIILNRPLFWVSIKFRLNLRVEHVYSDQRERNADNRKSTFLFYTSVSLHKIFTKSFQISIALVLIESCFA